jgi:hypothetical protein
MKKAVLDFCQSKTNLVQRIRGVDADQVCALNLRQAHATCALGQSGCTTISPDARPRVANLYDGETFSLICSRGRRSNGG